MKFTSIREYFYKLHNFLFSIMLVPLLAFVALYWQLEMGNIWGILKGDEYFNGILLMVFGSVIVVDWVISFLLFRRALKATLGLASLGEKLDRYFLFTLLRFVLVTSGSLGLAIGFYLTENQTFTILVVTNFVALLLFWPTPSKVCNDLHLKGDEQTMVLYKKERL